MGLSFFIRIIFSSYNEVYYLNYILKENTKMTEKIKTFVEDNKETIGEVGAIVAYFGAMIGVMKWTLKATYKMSKNAIRDGINESRIRF